MEKIKVKLIGEDGNIFNLIGIISEEMKKNNIKKDEIEFFQNEVMNCEDYYSAIRKMSEWVEIC